VTLLTGGQYGGEAGQVRPVDARTGYLTDRYSKRNERVLKAINLQIEKR